MKRLLCFFFSFSMLLADLALPEQALAWGPGAHMVTGNWILQNLSILPAAVAAALMHYPGQFLHGALSADIFIGKGSKAKKGHSHNWENGFILLESARGLQKLAYAYGYLAHLAADTVAHNVFVPGLLHTAPGSGRIAHVYLESQADRLLAWDSVDALEVFREKSSRRAAAMLCASMRQRPLPFLFKSMLFQKSIALGGSAVWRSSLKALDGLLPECERSALLERMLVLSARAMVDVLQKGEDSSVLALDPVGTDALARANKECKDKKLIARGVKNHLLKALPGKHSSTVWGPAELQVPIPSILENIPPVCTV